MGTQPTHERWNILLACLICLLPAVTVSTLGIVLPEIRGGLRLSPVEAGALFSVMFVLATITSPQGGRLADRIGRKPVLIVGTGTLALGIGLGGLSRNYPLTLALFGLAGVGYGFTSTTVYALLSDLLPRKRGLATSLVTIAYGVGAFAGSLVAGFLTAVAGWRASLLTIGAFGAALTGLVCAGVKPAAGHRSVQKMLPLRKAVNRNLVLLAAAQFSGGMMAWSMNSWGPTVLRSAKGLSLGETGLVMGLWGGAQMVGAILFGTLSDSLGRKTLILSTAYPAVLAAAGVYLFLNGPAALALGFALLGLLRSTLPTLKRAVETLLSKRKR